MNFTIVNKTTVLSAKRNSGKSELLRYLVRANHNKFKKIFVICPTEQINSFYKNIVPANCVYDEYQDEWVEDLIENMTKINAGKNNSNANHIL